MNHLWTEELACRIHMYHSNNMHNDDTETEQRFVCVGEHFHLNCFILRLDYTLVNMGMLMLIVNKLSKLP